MVTSACAQDIHITYGAGGEIRYALSTGTLAVYDHGRVVFHDVQALVKTGTGTYSSRDYATRTYQRSAVSDGFGRGVRHVITLRGPGLPVMRQVFYTYAGRGYFLAEVDVEERAGSSNYMAPLAGAFAQLTGDVRSVFVPFDNDTFISYDAKPVATGVTSAEAGAVYDNESRRGFVIGSVEHGVWKTAVKTSASDFIVWGGYTDVAVNRDPIPHGSIHGDVLRSPRVFVGYFADWRAGMEAFGKANRLADPPYVHPWTKGTPVGWNSWGVIQDKLTYDKAVKVVDFFADSLKGFRVGGTAFIDLDSYWDKLDSGQLHRFAGYCRSRGLQPGIYWAPFTDWGHRGGPDRKVQGSDYTYGELWTRVGDNYHDIDGARALDPTHPGTLRRIDYFTKLFRACGFRMIKIDFLGHAAAESTRFYDTTVTTGMQAYRRGMEYLVRALGPDMFLYAAISPSLATGRYVHSRRIACDAFKTIDHTRYTLNSVTYGWWQTFLYDYVDADHVVFDEVSPGENRARFLSSVITGTCISGDDFSSFGPWSSRARTWFQDTAFLAVVRNGKAFLPLEGNVGTSPVFYRWIGEALYVAVFNFDGQPREFSIDASRLGLPLRAFSATDLFSGVRSGTLSVRLGAADATLLRITISSTSNRHSTVPPRVDTP